MYTCGAATLSFWFKLANIDFGFVMGMLGAPAAARSQAAAVSYAGQVCVNVLVRLWVSLVAHMVGDAERHPIYQEATVTT